MVLVIMPAVLYDISMILSNEESSELRQLRRELRYARRAGMFVDPQIPNEVGPCAKRVAEQEMAEYPLPRDLGAFHAQQARDRQEAREGASGKNHNR